MPIAAGSLVKSWTLGQFQEKISHVMGVDDVYLSGRGGNHSAGAFAMKQDRTQMPKRLDAGGVCVQAQDWGDMNVARIRFPAGADATPLLQGQPDNLCQCPHWGTVVKGSIHVRYSDGSEEVVRAGDVYYWPPGHTVWVDEDYEAIEFSPSGPMNEIIEHLKSKMG